jgi:hypothetical protein
MFFLQYVAVVVPLFSGAAAVQRLLSTLFFVEARHLPLFFSCSALPAYSYLCDSCPHAYTLELQGRSPGPSDELYHCIGQNKRNGLGACRVGCEGTRFTQTTVLLRTTTLSVAFQNISSCPHFFRDIRHRTLDLSIVPFISSSTTSNLCLLPRCC